MKHISIFQYSSHVNLITMNSICRLYKKQKHFTLKKNPDCMDTIDSTVFINQQ